MEITDLIESVYRQDADHSIRPQYRAHCQRVLDDLNMGRVSMRKMALGEDDEGYTLFYDRGAGYAEIHVRRKREDIDTYCGWVLAPHSTNDYVGTTAGWEKHLAANPSLKPEDAAVKALVLVSWLETLGTTWTREPVDIRSVIVERQRGFSGFDMFSFGSAIIGFNIGMDMIGQAQGLERRLPLPDSVCAVLGVLFVITSIISIMRLAYRILKEH